jgi:polyisoprenyl-teichoic acid--peptidoglycan teichoic acid transferase
VGPPPKRTLPWRFAAASAVIVTSIATATAVAFLLLLTDIGRELDKDAIGSKLAPELASVEGGKPQTILILGSDKRAGTPGDPGRSDTTMLLRVDPERNYLALLSLPRDLLVEIPGYGRDRLNAAYSLGEQFQPNDGGGPSLTLKTVKENLGIDVNHIVNIDFEGFYDVVNAIGCVYIDVDRHYYNPEGGDYDDIDIQAGYTKLCGYRALDYVRYRHTDNDLVRGARQQDFLREARQQIPPRELLPFIPGNSSRKLIDIFTKYTTSDINDAPTIVGMLRSFVAVRNSLVRQVDLEVSFETIDGAAYVTATEEQIDTAVEQFFGEDLEQAPAPEQTGGGDGKGDKKKKDDGPAEPHGPAMIDVEGAALEYAKAFENELDKAKAKLPVYYPTKIPARSGATISPDSRGGFQIPGPENKDIYRGYKFVASFQDSRGFTAYYGVSGTNWDDPPILNNPSETRTIDGRDYMLFFDGDRLRLVGWKTAKGSYWVINTLTQSLSEDEMLAIATSSKEL